MNKKWLTPIILFICLSLAGIVAVQYLWIRNAFNIREAQFKQGVNDALGTVVSKLETSEYMSLIRSRLVSDSLINIIRKYAKDSLAFTQNQSDVDQLRRAVSQPDAMTMTSHFWNERQRLELDSVMEFLQKTCILNEQMLDVQIDWKTQELERLDSLWISQEKIIQRRMANGRVMVETHREQFTRPEIVMVMQHSSPSLQEATSLILEDKVRKLNKRTLQLQDLIRRMAFEFEELPKKVEARINKETLQNTIRASLENKDILLPFEFAVYNPTVDSNPIPLHSEGFRKEFLPEAHKVSLFPNDVIAKPDQLLVYFPRQKSHIIKSLSLLMFGSLFFTMIIIFSSGLSIFFMIRQKKISDIKTDFINNMTHEFKTPIATISIAADSINNPKVIQSPEQIKSFTKIIKEENGRMNSRVEQVLQMSLLDSKDFHLFPEPLDMHLLIERTVNHFRLIVEKRNGTISTRFEAANSIVEVDEGHMRNVLMNLLDNANKYSPGQPDISVYTVTHAGRFILGVEDRGIGMTGDVQKRIFDKFFRLTTGNVHNIKGFGLGLSYVKAITLAHLGEIKVMSEPGKGSRFEINLPIYRDSMNSVGI